MELIVIKDFFNFIDSIENLWYELFKEFIYIYVFDDFILIFFLWCVRNFLYESFKCLWKSRENNDVGWFFIVYLDRVIKEKNK